MLRLMRLAIVCVLAVVLGVVLYAALGPAQAGAPSLAPVSLQSLSETYAISTADGLALTLSADGQVTSLRIDDQELASAPAPALSLRDLSDAGTVITPNLVTNPGFEAGLSGWDELLNQGLEISVVVSPTHSGDQALAFTDPVTLARLAGYASTVVDVVPGQRYRASAWFRSSTGYVTYPSGTPPLMQKDLWQQSQRTNGVYVAWLDATGKALGNLQLAAPLHTDAYRWRLVRGELTAPATATRARLIIGARLENQTLWADDVAFVPSPEPDVALGGVVAPCPGQDDCLQQAITLSSGLVLTITYTAQADHIAVHGDIADLTGEDRALDVGWGVPLAATGGTWWDDAHNSRTITNTRLYVNEISAIYDGWLPTSLYPYAGVGMGDVGLALGLPMDRPQLALLSLNGITGIYGATCHLGISPQAVKVGPHATFDLMLYRFDPTWGFRDVIARHQKMQVNFYTTPRAQGLYEYQGRSQGQYYTPWGVHIVQEEDKANIYSAQYISSDMVLRVANSNQPRPTMDDIFHVLSLTLNSPYTESVALAQAITHSAAVEPNGDWSLKHVGIFPWDTEHWEAAWAGNVDPDIDEGLAPFLMDYRISRAFTATTQATPTAHLDGVQIDNFMTNPTFDLRPQALAASDWSLSYTPHTYQPAVHTGYAQEEFLAYLRHYLDENWGSDRAITINFWGLGHPNYLGRYIDGFGSEGMLHPNGEGPNWNPAILDYRRALTAQRPYLFTIQASGVTATQAYTAGQLALLYGVYPGHGPNGQGWDPDADQVISDTAHLVGRYWAAGWEPLTYARAEDEDVWLERFGSLTSTPPSPLPLSQRWERGRGAQGGGGEGLYFTLYNQDAITRTTAITIETTPLGLTDPATAVLTDIAITQTLPFQVVNGDIRFELTLGPQQTRVVRVSGGILQPTPPPPPPLPPRAPPTAPPTLTPSPTPVFPLYLPLIIVRWQPGQATLTPTPTPTPTLPPTPTSAPTLSPTPTLTPTPIPTTSALPFGVAYGEGSDNLDHFMTYVRDIGVRRSKVSFYWSKLEPQPGVYDFATLDEYLQQLQPDDQALLNVFSDGWCTNAEAEKSPKGATLRACPYGATSCEKSCAVLYSEFITTLATHVKANDHGGIKYWQRDTEPASPRHYPADKQVEYVEAQRIFYQAVKSVLPQAIVVGVNHNGGFTRGGKPSSETFFDYFLQYAEDYFDALDIRLYESEYTIFPRVDWFRQRMNQYGYDKPIISTEQGGPDPRTLHDQGVNLYDEFWTEVEKDCTGSPDPWQCLMRWIGDHFDEINPKLQVFLWPADDAQNAKRERMHCHDITQRNVLMLAAGVQATWWWNLQSGGVHPIFGKMRLMTRDYEALPGYACYQRMVDELGGVIAVEQITLADDGIYFYQVRKAGAATPMYVVWHREAGLDPYDAEAAPAVSATLSLGFDEVRVTDVFGNEEVRTAPGGVLTLSVSDTPLFLEAIVTAP